MRVTSWCVRMCGCCARVRRADAECACGVRTLRVREAYRRWALSSVTRPFVAWRAHWIVGFSFSEGLRILTRKLGDREEIGFWRNCLPVHDVMRSFFEGFATISSLSMTSCAVFPGGKQLSIRQLGCSTTIKSILEQVQTFSLFALKMLLLFSFTFGPTAQICAKTPKYERPIIFFLFTHAHGLLRAHSTSFFPPIFNRVNEASLRSPNNE